jgi:uncharacterized protein (TIGR03086 family)
VSVTDFSTGLLERYRAVSAGFERTLREVHAGQWGHPTPCAEWTVRQLVNHVARGNLNYRALLAGGTAADFLRLRDIDALGAQPVVSCRASVRACADAFEQPGAFERVLDYPLGRVSGRQALAVRTADTLVHTWDLATAVGTDDTLDAGHVAWLETYLHDVYAGLPETPVSATTTHRFFGPPTAPTAASRQDRLLRLFGRTP